MKEYTIEEIREKLESDIRWAERGLVRIYQNQTVDEQELRETIHSNGVGFTGWDAEILTSFAQRSERGWGLTGPQKRVLFRRMPKYAGQLHKMAYGG